MTEFLLIFGEINFMEVPKICKICKIYGPQKGHPTVKLYSNRGINKGMVTRMATQHNGIL